MIDILTLMQHKETLKKKKRPKYGNHKTTVDGLIFDSKREAKRWGELNILLKGGMITNLKRQVPFNLDVKGRSVGTYYADFTYHDDKGFYVVEDVKSIITRKDPVYRLKKRLMDAIHNIDIAEVL